MLSESHPERNFQSHLISLAPSDLEMSQGHLSLRHGRCLQSENRWISEVFRKSPNRRFVARVASCCFHIASFHSCEIFYEVIDCSTVSYPQIEYMSTIYSSLSCPKAIMFAGCVCSMLGNDSPQIENPWLIDEVETSKGDKQLLESLEICIYNIQYDVHPNTEISV